MKSLWDLFTRRRDGITFAVDNVIPTFRALPATQLDASLTMRSDCNVLLMPDRGVVAAMTPHMQSIERSLQRNAAEKAAGQRFVKTNFASSFTHPLIETIHVAFSDHRPLVLSPDTIWLVIAQGFGMHVRENAEALRSRLVRHRGKKTLEVIAFDFDEDNWRCAIDDFSRLIRENSDPVLHETLICDFSTTTASIRTASEVALMDTFEPFFDYRMRCVCGIPRVTLAGTAEDWRRMRSRVEVLATYDLEWWISRVRPILDEFVRTAEGKPDRAFWRAIYKPEKVYASELVTGWVADLFPYLGGEEKQSSRTLEKPRVDWIVPVHNGVATNSFGSGISRVPVKLMGRASGRVDVMGGYFGIGQDATTRALFPIISWAVVESPPHREHSSEHKFVEERRRRAIAEAQARRADS